jgi:hypothetical protein
MVEQDKLKYLGGTFLEIGRELLSLYLPVALPTEPTQVIPRLEAVGGRPYYHGKIGGVHIIKLSLFKEQVEGDYSEDIDRLTDLNDPVFSNKIFIKRYVAEYYSLQSSISMVHELIHQRHAEVLGQKTLMSSIRREPTLANDVIEGVSTMGELIILKCLLDNEKPLDVNSIPYHRALDAFEIQQYNRLKIISPYSIGRKLMKGLYKKFGMENMPDLIKQIDLEKCWEIPFGTKRYNEIISNPLEIPGITFK